MPEAEADRRIAANRADADAMVAKADSRLNAGDHRAASAFYAAGLGLLERAGRGREALAARVAEAIAGLDRRFRDHLVEGLRTAGFARRDWHPRFAASLAIMLGERQRAPVVTAYPQLPTSFYYADLPDVDFVDRSAFSWAEAIEARTDAIRAEALGLLDADGSFQAYVRRAEDRPQGDAHGMLDNRDWSSFELTRRGEFLSDGRCPATVETLLAHAPLCRIAGRAPTPMFSLLAAGRRIPPHTGVINTRLVCHLPLVVPGEGKLRVGSQARQWVEGELLVFDDTVEHEAWNDADKDRLVLIFDIWRPELEEVEREQIQALFEVVDAY